MLVEVALPLPLHRTFSYRLETPCPPGSRVRVPFGRRRLIGWVVGAARAEEPPEGLRDVLQVLDREPSVPADLLGLSEWIAHYYLASRGQVLRAMLPAALSAPGRADPQPRTRSVLSLTRELPSLQEREEVFGRARRQRELFELLESSGGSAEVSALVDRHGFSRALVRGLVERGVARLREEERERDPFTHLDRIEAVAPSPTPAQSEALDRLLAAAAAPAADPRPFVLHGVTGSGKTLVYIELLRRVVESGRGAIVLVPEIALTPQTVARFRSRFGDSVAVLHSALSEGERYDAWRALKSGERRIAVGARSAVFAPVRDLGVIVVDEEHESTYKQSETPRYHAREVAVVRARAAAAVCVLGSATPSLESWANVEEGKYRLLRLPERVAGRPLPPVRVVDLRKGREGGRPSAGGGGQRREPGPGSGEAGILSPALVAAVNERLERSEQSILLLNRRGYSTFVQCRSCGQVWHCPHCNVSLTYHRRRSRVLCHHCLHEEPAPVTCERCGSNDLSFRGVGTEQVERAVAEGFPGARLARMDVDTTSGKWAHHRILERVERREVDILLGTQMIAKGLDFPGVTLVGVINADVGINLPDFRASERTFQLLTQVAGRAGRGELGGEVLIQTALPGHYAVTCALEHDYDGFARRELEERREPGYPPHTRLTNVVLSGLDEEPVRLAAEEAAEWTLSLMRELRVPGVRLTGPAPCPIDRVRGRWRWHFLLRSDRSGPLGWISRRLLTGHRPTGGSDLRMVLDRDPVALL